MAAEIPKRLFTQTQTQTQLFGFPHFNFFKVKIGFVKVKVDFDKVEPQRKYFELDFDFENVSVLLKVLLNLQPKLYVLLKYLFCKTCEF